MAKTRAQKEEAIKNLSQSLKQVKGAVFADYTGLKVEEMQELRKKLKDTNSCLTAAKKSLFKIAVKESGLKGVDENAMPGAVSVATSSEDEVLPAKVMAEFAKEHEALKIQGGILENKFIESFNV